LFSQGVVSGASLMDLENRNKIINKITDVNKDFNGVITKDEFNSHDYEIVYAIIYEGNKEISKKLPFFSRLNMMINIKLLNSMNYKVTKYHIEKRKS
jgi:uncharacterized protein (TIGR04141 family)